MPQRAFRSGHKVTKVTRQITFLIKGLKKKKEKNIKIITVTFVTL
jgi:hypothetical protein